jgi:hypothetical protein
LRWVEYSSTVRAISAILILIWPTMLFTRWLCAGSVLVISISDATRVLIVDDARS